MNEQERKNIAKLNWILEGLPIAKQQKDELIKFISNLTNVASEETAGLMKQGASVAKVSTEELADVKNTLNQLIQSLTTAGIIASAE